MVEPGFRVGDGLLDRMSSAEIGRWRAYWELRKWEKDTGQSATGYDPD